MTATTEADLFRSYALDSLALNQTLAALDERMKLLVRDHAALCLNPPTPTRDFALACNRDAIRDTERARLAFARQVPEFVEPDAIDEYKAAADRGQSYHDVQAG